MKRFVVLVKARPESEAGAEPSAEEFAEMAKFNERLHEAGRMVLAEGLSPSSEAVRVVFEGDAEPRVLDGPFTETKELVAGFWVLNGDSLEDVVELMKEVPNPGGQDGVVEIRPVRG